MRQQTVFAALRNLQQKNLFPFDLALAVGLMCSIAQAQKSEIITFDPPGSVYTLVEAINNRGEITGAWADANFVFHGFLRSPDGTIISFDAPKATTTGYGTFGIGINDTGTIVGYYTRGNFNYGGFERNPDGTFFTYRYPDQCTGGDPEGCQGTGFFVIDNLGEITGAYLDKNFVQHGLLVSPNHNVKVINAPGAGAMPGSFPGSNYFYQGTNVSLYAGVNFLGTSASDYVDENFVYHGYVRDAHGNYTRFDPPQAGTENGDGTIFGGLNNFSVITGYTNDNDFVAWGYIRYPNDTYTVFQAPGADFIDPYGTLPANINDFGAVTGDYLDSNAVYHAFIRQPNGTFVEFDAPGADQTPGSFDGTFPSQINFFGTVAGTYYDSNAAGHGFVRILCNDECGSDASITAAALVHPKPSSEMLKSIRRLRTNRSRVPWGRPAEALR